MDPVADLLAADRLLLDVAAELAPPPVGVTAALELSATAVRAAIGRLTPARVQAHADRLAAEHELERTAAADGFTVAAGLDAALDGAELVLWRLPTGLDALDEVAARVAAHADPAVVLLGVGNTKQLTHRMNAVLGRSFTEVRASRGRGRFRVLIARGPRPGADPDRYPRTGRPDGLGLQVVAHGGTFAGARLDDGTRLLLGTRERWPAPAGPDVIDLGCGTGIIAATLARAGHRRVLGLDDSITACDSARATIAANGLSGSVEIRREDGLAGRPGASASLIISNPPFHRGAAKDSGPALSMIEDAARVLRPGGELWLVFNSHLPYLPAVRRLGPTELVTRDRSYLVTRSIRS